MSFNSFGRLFRVTTFGESHGPAFGLVIDGCPARVALSEEDLRKELHRRRPGRGAVTSGRQEPDEPAILSGVFEGLTTGMPIAVVVMNRDANPADYEQLRKVYRPGHADEVYACKYGHRDHRGGGRSSGRETVSRVIAGSVARKVLPETLQIIGHAVQVGPHRARVFRPETIEQNEVRCADPAVALEMERYILGLKKRDDSTGGLVEVRVRNLPAGLGDPVFGKLKARLADAMLSIGAVTGFSYGAGFAAAGMTGTEYIAEPAHFGGILGGISTGADLLLRVSVKPTVSVGEVARRGRHDPCIVPRIIPVVEAMVALVLADCCLLQLAQFLPGRGESGDRGDVAVAGQDREGDNE